MELLSNSLIEFRFVLGLWYVVQTTMLSKTKKTALKRHAVKSTLQRMQNHDVFKAGLQISSYSDTIKPSLILNHTDAQISALMQAAFEFDAQIGGKSANVLKPYKECRARHNGLCCTDPSASRAGMGSKNIYNWIKIVI